MLIPNKISVLGVDVLIKTVTQDYLKARDSEEGEGNNTHAYYSISEQVIYLDEELSDENMRRILLHELFHAFLGISGQTNHFTDAQEEGLCDLAENLLPLFRQEQLLEMILEGDGKYGNEENNDRYEQTDDYGAEPESFD